MCDHRSHLCGYDINLTYPQNGKFPTLNPPFDVAFSKADRSRLSHRVLKSKVFRQALQRNEFDDHVSLDKRDMKSTTLRRMEKRDAWKRDLAGRANGTIDPFYECDLFFEMIDYATNFSLPWSQ